MYEADMYLQRSAEDGQFVAGMVFPSKSAVLALGVELQAGIQVPMAWLKPLPIMRILV